MQKLSIALVALLIVSLSSCELIGGIFKAGVGVGMFIVIAVIILIIFVLGKLFGGRK